jgi:hypothetical protein
VGRSSAAYTPAQAVAVEHVCLLAEECAHPRFGYVLPLGTLNLTINAGYE